MTRVRGFFLSLVLFLQAHVFGGLPVSEGDVAPDGSNRVSGHVISMQNHDENNRSEEVLGVHHEEVLEEALEEVINEEAGDDQDPQDGDRESISEGYFDRVDSSLSHACEALENLDQIFQDDRDSISPIKLQNIKTSLAACIAQYSNVVGVRYALAQIPEEEEA